MTVIKNRDVPGGKEFWDHVENVAANFQPPEIKSDSIGGRGMMTAEQAPQSAMDVEKYLTHQKAQAIARQYGLDPAEESFAKAVGAILCTAAQLAEKEREIERLNKLFCNLTPGGSEFVNDADYCAAYLQKRRHALHEVAKNAVIRAQGAEQRLQEAQARIKELEG